MIPNEEGQNYPSLKNLSALLRRITFKHHGGFYCLNCLHSFAAENKRESHKKVCENTDFCNAVIPFIDTKILELINI